jgi:hypothetical protein
MHPDIDAWQPWDPATFAARMPGADFPWYVAGGWAIDLFAGEQTREHEDLEVAVASSFFSTMPPRFPELDFWVPQGEGELARMTTETLAGESHQTWAYDRTARAWRFDVFREPHDGDIWICRRDESIRRPYEELVDHSADGIPYLRPEVVLLFKAKHVRDKDRADLATAWPRMTEAQRDWLRESVARVHPGHDWATLR